MNYGLEEESFQFLERLFDNQRTEVQNEAIYLYPVHIYCYRVLDIAFIGE